MILMLYPFGLFNIYIPIPTFDLYKSEPFYKTQNDFLFQCIGDNVEFLLISFFIFVVFIVVVVVVAVFHKAYSPL